MTTRPAVYQLLTRMRSLALVEDDVEDDSGREQSAKWVMNGWFARVVWVCARVGRKA